MISMPFKVGVLPADNAVAALVIKFSASDVPAPKLITSKMFNVVPAAAAVPINVPLIVSLPAVPLIVSTPVVSERAYS
jgi:hypothetical protein